MSKHKSKFAKNRVRTRRNKGKGVPIGTKGKVPYWATHAVKATENAALFLEANHIGPYNVPAGWGEASGPSSLEDIEKLARHSRENGIPVDSPGVFTTSPRHIEAQLRAYGELSNEEA